jgi:predicted site-specific integrase-resolvase
MLIDLQSLCKHPITSTLQRQTKSLSHQLLLQPKSEIKRLLGEEAPKGKVAIYARVSSADQKEDLER